ncbi:MAG: hypothetical protein ACK2T0_00125, partial [Anaerolineales bacterium]
PLAVAEHFPAKLDGEARAEYDAESAVPLGLALKGLGADTLDIDFRQEELRVANKFELLKNPLAVTVTLLSGWMMISIRSQAPASASSMALSTTSYTR